ncbi:MAG: hypothetical protein U1E39_07615 [Planctomycetota bacterium]
MKWWWSWQGANSKSPGTKGASGASGDPMVRSSAPMFTTIVSKRISRRSPTCVAPSTTAQSSAANVSSRIRIELSMA